MKNYTITVNGNVYDVTVEENGAGAPAAAPVAAPRAAAPAAPAAAPKAAAGAGSIQVKAGAAGKVFQVPTSVGRWRSQLLPQRQELLPALMWQ